MSAGLVSVSTGQAADAQGVYLACGMPKQVRHDYSPLERGREGECGCRGVFWTRDKHTPAPLKRGTPYLALIAPAINSSDDTE